MTVVTPVKPKELITTHLFPVDLHPFMRIFMSALHIWPLKVHTLFQFDDFSIKPVYKLPAEQNAHPKQLMQEGIRDAEVKSSPQFQDSFRNWEHWVNLSSRTMMMYGSMKS